MINYQARLVLYPCLLFLRVAVLIAADVFAPLCLVSGSRRGGGRGLRRRDSSRRHRDRVGGSRSCRRRVSST